MASSSIVRRSLGSLHLAALALYFTLHCISPSQAGDFNIKECFTDHKSKSSGEGHVTITCSVGHKIAVDEALLGRSRYGICGLTDEDCLVPTTLFHSCDGSVGNCTKIFKTYSTECGGNVTTLLLSYWCIRVLGPTTSPAPTSAITEGQPVSTKVPRVTTASPASRSTKRHTAPKKEEDGEDIGLVVGCAIAAVVTIIMLLIAITMVIRALLQYHKRGKDDQPPGRIVSCMDAVCLQVDRLPCFSSNDANTEDNPAKGLHEDGGGSTRSAKHYNAKTESVTDASSKYVIDRMAPVGQECSSTSSVDSGLSEMQNHSNLSSPQQQHHRNHHHHHYHPPQRHKNQQQQPQQKQHRSQQQQNIGEGSSDTCHDQHPSAESSNRNSNSATRSSKNSSHQTKNCPDKVSTWRQKEMTHAGLSGHKDSNQISSDSLEAERDTSDVSRPMFDALAIPNTETGTLC